MKKINLVFVSLIISMSASAGIKFDQYVKCDEEIGNRGNQQVNVKRRMLGSNGILSTNYGNGDGYFAIFRKSEIDLFCAFEEEGVTGTVQYNLKNRGETVDTLVYDHKENKMIESSLLVSDDDEKMRETELDCYALTSNSQMEQVIKEHFENDVLGRLELMLSHSEDESFTGKSAFESIQNGACEGVADSSEELKDIIAEVKEIEL